MPKNPYATHETATHETATHETAGAKLRSAVCGRPGPSLALALTFAVATVWGWGAVPGQVLAQDGGSVVAGASEQDPVAQALRQRLQAWSQRNADDAKTVFDEGQGEEGRAAAASISQAQQQVQEEEPTQPQTLTAPEPVVGQSDAPEALDLGAEPAPTNEPTSEEQAKLTQPNAVETQSLTGDRELDALLSDSQKILLVQAIQTLQVINKEDEQAREVASALTESQKQALLKLLRTLEEVQADQAEGQQGFSDNQRAAIVDVLETLEREQLAIEQARQQAEQRARSQQAYNQAQAQAQAQAAQSGLGGGLLTAEQEAALASGLAKLQAAQQAQNEGRDAQAVLDMSADERQALLAVIQLIEALRQQQGGQADVASLSEDQKQALVAAVTRLQVAQQQRAAMPTSAVASASGNGAATSTNAAAGNQAQAANGPLNDGLLATLGDTREVNADLAIVGGAAKDAASIGRHKTLLYTTVRSSGSVQTGVNYRSGTLRSGAWEADFGIDASGELSSLFENAGPIGNYRIVPDATVLRRLTNQISLKAAAQGEFIKNAGAALASLGLVYSRGNTEVTGNIFGKYEYLQNPSCSSDNVFAFIDAVTIGADLGASQPSIVLGPTTTDISAKLTLSQVID